MIASPIIHIHKSAPIPTVEFYIAIIAVAAIFMIAGCRSSGKVESQHTEKMDAPLRMLLAGQHDHQSDDSIPVLIEMASVPDGQILSLFERYGIKVTTVSGNIVAASGKAAGIRRIAAEDAVVSLSLAMERQLHQ